MSPELWLVAACCRWPHDDEAIAAVATAADRVRDWPEFLSLAQAHRVVGLVGRALDGSEGIAPPEIHSAIACRSAEIRATALRQVAETLRLSQRFHQHGLQHRVLKGMPLGVLVYSTPSLKECWDIDLLVKRSDAVAAVALLRDLGYQPRPPAGDFGIREFERWAVVSKDLILRSPEGLVVELHWRVSDQPMLLKGLDAATPGREVAIFGGSTVPTLSDSANLAYLAVHGAFHGWSRLKWLADYSALLRLIGSNPRPLVEARKFAPGRAVDQALLLSEKFFGGTAVRPDRPNSKAAQRLAQLGSEVISRRTLAREIDSDAGAQARMRMSQWLVLRSIRYRAMLVTYWARGSEDRQHFALPKGMGWAYWLMRPFTAAYRTVSRRFVNRRDATMR